MRQNFTERPPEFFLCDEQHPFKQQLAFADLGRFPGTTRCHDSSLYGNTGTLTGHNAIPTWSCALGRSLCVFSATGIHGDDSQSWISVPAGASLKPSSAITMAAWIYPTSWIETNYYQCLIVQGRTWETDSPCNADMALNITTHNLELWNGSSSYDAGVAPALNTWTHVAVTATASAVDFYVNGSFVVSRSGGIGTTGTAGMYIGCFLNSGGGYEAFIGSMADPMYWVNRTLSASEIQALADPSNVMLSIGGNPLLRYRRKWWGVSSGGAAAKKIPVWMRQYRQRWSA